MSKKKAPRIKPFKRTPVPTLDNSIVELKLIRKQIRDEMQIILRQEQGPKAIILGMSLMKIVNCVFETDELTQWGVKHIFPSHRKYIQSADCGSYFFFVRSQNMTTLRQICTQIRTMKGLFSRPSMSEYSTSKPKPKPKPKPKMNKMDYSFMKDSAGKSSKTKPIAPTEEKKKSKAISIYVYCIPRKTKLTEFHFEKNGLLCRIKKIGSFGLDLIPIDTNLITLSIPSSFYQLSYHKNTDVCYNSARSIIKFESMFGLIPSKRYIGKHAKTTYEILCQLEKILLKHERDYGLSDDDESSDLELSDLSSFSEPEEEEEEEEEEKEVSSSKKKKKKRMKKVKKKKKKKPKPPKKIRLKNSSRREICVIDELIIIDRSVDLITPLLTPLTYEALINHLFGIEENGIFDYTKIKLHDRKIEEEPKKKQPLSEKTNADSTEPPKEEPTKEKPQGTVRSRVKKMILNEDDEVFRLIRNRNIMHIAKQLTIVVNECKVFEDKENYNDLEKMKSFMVLLPRYQSKKKDLACHLAISSQVKDVYPMLRKRVDIERFMYLTENEKTCFDYMENMVVMQEPLVKVLNYLVLISLMNNGVKPKFFERFQRELIQSYGIAVLLYLKQLKDVGLLVKKGTEAATNAATTSLNYSSLRKKLNLFTDDESSLVRDIHYVYTGYAAQSIRLIQELLRNRAKSFQNIGIPVLMKPKILLDLEGVPVASTSTTTSSSSSSSSSTLPIQKNKNSAAERGGNSTEEGAKKQKTRRVLLFFVGGISRAEINTIRFLERSGRWKFLICSTDVFVNFMDQFTKLM